MKKNAVERVASIEKSRESKAAKKLSADVGAHKAAEVQQNQIMRYRDEYESTLDHLSQTGVDPRTLNEYRQFLTNLDSAIDQQSRIVEDAEQKVGDSRAEWLTRYHRKSALDQLAELQRTEERAGMEKRSQKETDEISAQIRSRSA